MAKKTPRRRYRPRGERAAQAPDSRRKTRFVDGKRVQFSAKIPLAVQSMLQRKASDITERDGYLCTTTEAMLVCVYEAMGVPLPEGNIKREVAGDRAEA